MVCARYRDALTGVAAGAAAPAALEAHLTGCQRCRAELVALRQLLTVADQGLAHLSSAEPAGSFVPRIRAAMAFQAVPVRRANWLWPSLATAAAVGLVALFVGMRPARETAAVVEVPSKPEAAAVAAPESSPASGPEPNIVDTSPPKERPATRRKPAEPEVLVPADEARALVQWVALVNREQRVPTLLAAADAAELQNLAPTNIQIQPIEFVPLDPANNPGT
jgi:hypothetical protein